MAQDATPVLDFEDGAQELSNFGAVYEVTGEQPHFQPAGQWTTPFAFEVVADQAHGGSHSLLWEFFEATDGKASLRLPVIPISSEAGSVMVKFFVRTENVDSEGILSLGEMTAAGGHLQTQYGIRKIPISPDWTEVDWSGPLGSGAEGIRITIDYKDLPAKAKVWIDAVTVTPNPEAP